MCSLCWLPVAQNHNFGQILTFGGRGSCTDPLLPMRSKFSAACARADPWCTLRAMQISSRSIYSVARRQRQNPNFSVFWTSVVVSLTASNLIKLNMGAQLQTKASKSFTPSWRNGPPPSRQMSPPSVQRQGCRTPKTETFTQT